MKKLFLFMAVSALTFSLNSCSSSDSGSSKSGTITVKIDGVAKTFNSVVVNEELITDDGEPYTELTVTGAIGTSTTEILIFSLEKGSLGADAIYSMYYSKNSNQAFGFGVTTNVTTNNNSKKLIGNFSGTFSNGTDSYQFTEGTFNIQY